MSATIEELRNEYTQLEHENFIEKNYERPPTREFVERVMKCLADAIALAEVQDEDLVMNDTEESAKEIMHRINLEMDSLRTKIGEIVNEELEQV